MLTEAISFISNWYSWKNSVLGMETLHGPSSETYCVSWRTIILKDLARYFEGLKVFSISSKRRFFSLFFCCRSAKMKIIQFFLLDHVRHSWAECLFKETPKLLNFLRRVAHSVLSKSPSWRPPCSSYSNPLS